MGDPVGVARVRAGAPRTRRDGAAGRALGPGRPPANIAENPLAALLYMASAAICTPNSLSQEVGLGLGAQAGEARLREVFEDAGYTHFRRATQTPLNMIIEARA